VASQSRRQSAGQDTIPAPRRCNMPDGLLARHSVPHAARPLRMGVSWSSTAGPYHS